MASIGPQLPPHLQKRKRTPEDDQELGSPPPKTSRRDNEDEIPLDDDSDDDFGPSAPPPAENKDQDGPRPAKAVGPSLPAPAAEKNASDAPADQKRPIGPSLPPPSASATAAANKDEIPLDDDDDDDATGPAPPPPRHAAATTAASPAASPPKRVIGPALPPADYDFTRDTEPDGNPDPDRDGESESSSDDDDDDDEWGPALPTEAGGASSAAARLSGAAATASAAREEQPSAPKRDDWMLAPPTSSGHRAPDPTRLRSRKFASGPRAATEAKPAGISSIWTETPEEKARRLANAVLGREDPTGKAAAGAARPSRPDAAAAAAAGGSAGNSGKVDETRVRSYTEQTRGRSLVEEYQAARQAGKAGWGERRGGKAFEEEEDDPSKRAFDWEKDMKVAGRISLSQRKEMLNRASSFVDRFQKGSYL